MLGASKMTVFILAVWKRNYLFPSIYCLVFQQVSVVELNSVPSHQGLTLDKVSRNKLSRWLLHKGKTPLGFSESDVGVA